MSYINKDFFENAENQQKAMQINWEIADCLHQFGKLPCNGFPLVPYLLHNASQYSNPFGITLQAITDGKIEVNEDVRFMAKEVLTDELWERLLQLVMKYSPEEFALAAVNPVTETNQRER